MIHSMSTSQLTLPVDHISEQGEIINIEQSAVLCMDNVQFILMLFIVWLIQTALNSPLRFALMRLYCTIGKFMKHCNYFLNHTATILTPIYWSTDYFIIVFLD